MKAFTKLFMKLFDYSAALLFLLTATVFSQISLAQESGQAASSRDIKNSTSIGTNMVMPSAMLTSCKPGVLSDKVKSPNAMKFLRDAIELQLKTKDKVSLDLFVMSQCPFGVMAEQSIIPVIREFGNRVEFRLNFIAGEDVVNGQTVLNSLHGQPEIDEDIRQLVIARDFPEKLFAYLEARAENYRDDNWQTAAGKAGINADVLNLAAKSQAAQDLFRTNMKKAQTSGVNASPTLWIEGVKYMDQLIDPTASSATACQTGNDPYTGSPYVVCTATPTYAWISANSGGSYHINLICQSLGYAGIGRWGGTCGNVCGYCQGTTSCSSRGSATFDAGTSPNNCGFDSHGPLWCNTIQWECVVAPTCTAPTITCSSNITVNNTPGSCGAVVNYPAATATGTSPTITYSQNSGTFFPVGTTTVTATATNTCGTASCTFTVTVNDNQPPVITCPANVTRQCDESTHPSATGYATATDNCGSAVVSYSDASTSGNFLYLQTWESGTGGWFSKHGSGDPVVLVSDPTAPSPSTVHKITNCESGGHYYSPLISVIPGQTYCFSLWIRWEGGCWPFLGIDRYNAAGTYLGENWLIGQPGYPDGFGGTVTPVPANASGWNLYFKTITIPAGVTKVRLKNEMFIGASKGGATLGFFDNIGFTNGSCTNSPGFCNQNYQILRTWTATDGSGNTSSCQQTITVVDNTPPVITCPANITIQCNTSTAAAATGTATATDNCSTPAIGYSDVSALTGCNGTGTITRTWRATDECGNSSTCVQTITVIDNTAPTFTRPADIILYKNADCAVDDTRTGDAGDVTDETDNCSTGLEATFSDVVVQNCEGSYTITRTWSLVDDCNNAAANQVQTITVKDNTNPVITCPADITVVNATGQCGANVNFTATATDNCSTPVITYSKNPGSFFIVGTTLVTATATDACNNQTQCSFNVTVTDTEAPSITCPANISVSNTQGLCQATITVPAPVVMDNCSSLLLGNALNFDGIDDVVTVAASSPINTINQSQRTVEVYFRVNDKNISSRKQVIWEEGGNANGVNIYVFNGRLYYGVYSRSLGWNGTWLNTPAINSGQWHNAVLVYDGTITTGRLKAYLDGNLVGSADASAVLGTAINQHPNSNAVGALSVNGIFHDGIVNLNLGHFFGGDIDEIRLWTVPRTAAELAATNTVQLNGNETGLVVYYTFDQGVACGINTGLNTLLDGTVTGLNGFLQSMNTDGSTGCNSNWTNGSPALSSSIILTNSYTHTANASGTYPVGTTNVVWTATDAAGNSASCTQVITVNDTESPVITCPADISVNNDEGQCAAAIAISPATATDNCEVASVTGVRSDALALNAPYPVGTTTITWSATDIHNLTATCIQTITVTDAEAPIITCPADISVNNDEGQCAAAIAISPATATDNCEVASVTGVRSDALALNAPYPVGTTTITWSATDIHNLTATCIQTITVTDSEAPIITCPADISVNNDEGLCTASVTITPATATDNCEVSSVVGVRSDALALNAPYPVGTTTITWTATDIHDLISTCIQTVVVTDNTDPVITCPADFNVNSDPGKCGAAVNIGNATATDNCEVASVIGIRSDALALTADYPVGTTTITWTATDVHGLTATCTQTVVVIDTEKPVITLSIIFRCFADDNFGCSINLGATATDNCQVISLTSNAPGCFPVGTTTVTWTATDNHGNVTTKTQMVTRNPEINISICAGPTRTIYRGTTSGVGPFGPQSVNLTSTVSGGTPGYTYSWSPAAGLSNPGIANPVANPAVTTTYTLTVTDSKGCQRSLSITINVLPLSSAVCSGNGNNVKFSVCHIPPGNPSNQHNICISVNALNAHLTSGSNGHNNCYLGPCQQNCYSTVPGGQSFVVGPVEPKEVVYVEVPEEMTDDFKVNVYPNPSAGEFNLQVFSKSIEPITVRILDVNGIVRSLNTVISKSNSVKVGSNLTGGTYMAEVTQGRSRALVKLVKLN